MLAELGLAGKRRALQPAPGGNRIGDAHSARMFRREHHRAGNSLIPSTSLSGAGEKSAKRVKASATLRWCVRGIIRPVLDPPGILGVNTRGKYVRTRSKRPK